MNDVYLHIGPVKTGSTYLQSIVWNNRGELRRQGLLLPAERENEHFLAANDIQDCTFVHVDLPEAQGAWDRVAGRVRRWDGRALISHELLGFSEPQHVRRIVESLTWCRRLFGRCLTDDFRRPEWSHQ